MTHFLGGQPDSGSAEGLASQLGVDFSGGERNICFWHANCIRKGKTEEAPAYAKPNSDT